MPRFYLLIACIPLLLLQSISLASDSRLYHIVFSFIPGAHRASTSHADIAKYRSEGVGSSEGGAAPILSFGSLRPVSNTDVEAGLSTFCGRSHTEKLDLSGFSTALRNAFRKFVLYDDSSLEREWIKHGSCSNLSQKDYFTLAMNSYRIYKPVMERSLTKYLGLGISYKKLSRSFFADHGDHIVLLCAPSHAGQILTGVAVLISGDPALASLGSTGNKIEGKCNSRAKILLPSV